ncbi:hypothetical protein Salat_2325100 [Sesamum alatum]|uniref:DUF7086 domain-containing protein n=1 Tax=Sesamum alatum TaxID=300844 RepID=A0AAE1XW17_9LAMI|nr:hypothetical protein Salat_2325100 [Sesamum alatum]
MKTMNSNIQQDPSTAAHNADFLNLSLSTPSSPSSTAPPPPFPHPPPPSSQLADPAAAPPPQQDTVVGPSRKRRVARRSSTQTLRPGKSETIAPPYPWATPQRATIHNLQYLIGKGITKIKGRVQCKRCDRQYDLEYDLQTKFAEVAMFIMKNRDEMRQRAPPAWMNPTLPDCKYCEQQNCVKPILTKKKSINWLFLLLGQMVGCCKLSELKYFCKHTKNHRTGAKDRVLYLTYLELCRQLNPEGPYDR